MSTTDSFPRFLDLPAEQRNEIYKLLVVEQGKAIKITRSLPRVAQVNKQLREESLVIFLVYNSFYCGHVPEKVDFLVHWLHAMGGTLRYLKCLKLDCVVPSLDVSTPDRPKASLGELRPWHEMVACLSAFNVQPSQLRFGWAVGFLKLPNCPLHFTNAVAAFFFSRYALEPMLADYGLLHQSPTLNVLADLATAESLTSDIAIRDSARDAATKISALETTHASHPSCTYFLRSVYDRHMDEVFRKGANSIGRFYDLKYLYHSKGKNAYRHTKGFKAALESAVVFHRDRLQGKREWLTYAGNTFNPRVGTLHDRSATHSAVLPGASRWPNKSNTESRSWSASKDTITKKGRAASTFGSIGAIVPAPSFGISNFAMQKPSSPYVVAPRKALSTSASNEYDASIAPGCNTNSSQAMKTKSNGTIQPTERSPVTETTTTATASATGAAGTLAKPALGFSMFSNQCGDYDGFDDKSPFAAVEPSTEHGAGFTYGFSTQPSHHQNPAPHRPVFQWVTDSTGKRVLRRSPTSNSGAHKVAGQH